jgi:hypothetical protein
MSENTAKNKPGEDEIDLIDLFRRMGRTLNGWMQSLGRAFLITVVFLLKRWLPLGISIALGIGASYLLKVKSNSLFTSDLILKNNLATMDINSRDVTGTTSEMISKFNKLHKFCQEGNLLELSASLSVSEAAISDISDISAFWIIDKSKDRIPDYVDYNDDHDPYDTLNIRMQDRLDIRIKIKSPQDLNLVRNGILYFINSDSLYQQRNRLRLRQNREMLARTYYDIQQLDSLQKVKYFEETRNQQPKNGGQMIFLQEQKTQLLYGEIHGLYSQKQSLESQIDIFQGIVTILSDFTPPVSRENGTMYYAKMVIPIFFCFALIILIMYANRRKLVETFNKY